MREEKRGKEGEGEGKGEGGGGGRGGGGREDDRHGGIRKGGMGKEWRLNAEQRRLAH